MPPIFTSNVLAICFKFISNLAAKFRNITCKIQKLPSKKARKNPEKFRENKKSAPSSEDQTEEPMDRNLTSYSLYDMGLGTFMTK